MNKRAAGYALAIGGLVAAAGITWIVLSSTQTVAKPISSTRLASMVSQATAVATPAGPLTPAIVVVKKP